MRDSLTTVGEHTEAHVGGEARDTKRKRWCVEVSEPHVTLVSRNIQEVPHVGWNNPSRPLQLEFGPSR